MRCPTASVSGFESGESKNIWLPFRAALSRDLDPFPPSTMQRPFTRSAASMSRGDAAAELVLSREVAGCHYTNVLAFLGGPRLLQCRILSRPVGEDDSTQNMKCLLVTGGDESLLFGLRSRPRRDRLEPSTLRHSTALALEALLLLHGWRWFLTHESLAAAVDK